MGPTLARWLRSAEPQVHDSWMAQDDGHNGIAQAFHHTILPLASPRDRRTEIRWGLRDFELRVGRRATGIWLPETAVDLLTLRICAEERITWTILAPWQAATEVHGNPARRVEVGEDRGVNVLFYDAPLSATVSFDAGATADADRFGRDHVLPALRRDRRAPARGGSGHATGHGHGAGTAALLEPRVASPDGSPPSGDTVPTVVIATDGELYGHHQAFRDLFLARLVSHEDGFRTVTPGALMDGFATSELTPIALRDATSWSCHHGVARWAGECPDVIDGRWKRPLRQALDRLAASLDTLVERRLGELGLDLWDLRDRYVDVAAGFAEPRPWLARQLEAAQATGVSRLPGASRAAGRSPLLDADGEVADEVLALMAAVASRLQMFASDGWFWGDPRRIETAQTLRYAGHAAHIADTHLGTRLESDLVDDLSAVRCPEVPDAALPELSGVRDGAELYRAVVPGTRP